MPFASTTKDNRGRRLLLAMAWYCTLEFGSYPLIMLLLTQSASAQATGCNL